MKKTKKPRKWVLEQDCSGRVTAVLYPNGVDALRSETNACPNWRRHLVREVLPKAKGKGAKR